MLCSSMNLVGEINLNFTRENDGLPQQRPKTRKANCAFKQRIEQQ